jgi:hypothetical protein
MDLFVLNRVHNVIRNSHEFHYGGETFRSNLMMMLKIERFSIFMAHI